MCEVTDFLSAIQRRNSTEKRQRLHIVLSEAVSRMESPDTVKTISQPLLAKKHQTSQCQILSEFQEFK